MSIGAVPSLSSATTTRRDLLISQLHTAVDLDAFWKASLQLLSEWVPHHSCSLLYGIIDQHTLNSRHHMPGPRADRRSVSNLDIVHGFLARHPGVQLYTFQDVVSEDPSAQQRQQAQQSRHLAAWDDFVHLAFWDGPRPDAVLSVRRERAQGPFTPAEIALLRELHPVIEAGLQRLRRLADERSQHLSIKRFLAEVPVPVLFLNAQLRLIYASREGYAAAAEWNLGRSAARQLDPRRAFELPPAIAEACRQLEADPEGHRNVRVPHPSRRDLVARIQVDTPVSSPWSRPVYRVLFLTDRSLDDVPLSANPGALNFLQRLTPIERRVALLATEGCPNRTIAERLGKSHRTVECQLTEIYRKLGVRNRVQLTRVLA